MRGKAIILVGVVTVLTILALGPVARGEDVAALNAMIKARGARWHAGETSMSRLPHAERIRRLGLLRHTSDPGGRVLAAASAPNVTPPSGLDWRSNGGNYVTPVKDQGYCGSCWAFAATAAAESVVLIKNHAPNTDLDLSEQVLVSCSGAGSCEQGGRLDVAADYIRDTGLPVESCYPYTAADGTCSMACDNWQASAYKINNWIWVVPYGTTPTTDALKQALSTYGPLVTTMAVYSDFMNYASGVYAYTSGGLEGYHAILLVGYDDAGQYFIVKNSWGTRWGESGYFRIAYSELTSVTQFGYETIAEGAGQSGYALTVFKAGTGNGTVTAYPSEITCYGAICSATYAAQTQVTLTATPDATMTFAGWSGGCSGTGACTVLMNAAQSVTATFNLAPGPRITSIVDRMTRSATIGPNSLVAIYGASFSTGGNTVQLQRPGYADVWLSEHDGHYFWDGSETQIVSSLDGRVAAGTWSATVHAASGGVSNPYSMTIQDTPGSDAYWCYSRSYAWYGYQNWLCDAAYYPTDCYTATWQPTSCP